MQNNYPSNTPNASPETVTRPPRGDYLEPSPYDSDGGNLIGVSPALLSKSDLLALGHPTSPIKSIRAKCLDCCGGNEAEARKCTAMDCPLWPLRMGRNVYHASACLKPLDEGAAK